MKLYDVIQKEQQKQHRSSPEVEETREVHEPIYTTRVRHKTRWRKLFVIGGSLLFLVTLYVAGIWLVRAKVVVTERRIPFTLENAEFELVHEGDASLGRLSFQTVMVTSEASRQVYGSQIQQSTSIAKGKVVFFNEYSTKAQTIPAKTMLTASSGKKYQTSQSVTVPGYTMKGKVKTAGTSTAVPIVATAVGPTFNTTGTSFSVGSFGKALYGQSAGAITGGEDGMSHSVAPTEQAGVLSTLQTQLTERLKRETRTQIPEAFVVYPDLQVPSIDSTGVSLRGEGVKFPATMKGTMTTYLIPRQQLETAIASHVLSDHTYPHVSIPTIASLTVTPITPLPADAKQMPDSIKVRISGEGYIITKAPIAVLTEALRGSRKQEFGSLINTYPEIDTAEYHFYPFWAPFFPTKEHRMTVEVK